VKVLFDLLTACAFANILAVLSFVPSVVQMIGSGKTVSVYFFHIV
jgi:hypothetical protein